MEKSLERDLNVLGLTLGCSFKDIRKKYHHLARNYHPDKNPETKKEYMQNLNALYNRICTKFNELKEIKSQLSISHTVEVTLEEFYNSSKQKVAIVKLAKCGVCNGQGHMPKKTTCSMCLGRTVVYEFSKVFLQLEVVICNLCDGAGMVYPKCRLCGGEGTVKELDEFVIQIFKGMKDGDEIPVIKKGSYYPDGDVTGDIIITLRQIEHKVFTRKGNDLYTTFELEYYEAFYIGVRRTIKTLDGRILVITLLPGEIKECKSKTIKNEGMPFLENAQLKGDLIVHFSVKPIISDYFYNMCCPGFDPK